MAPEQIPGETTEQYRLRILEGNFSSLDAKVETIQLGQVEIKTTLDGLVATSKTKATNASTLRIGITVGLVVAALGVLVWAVETAVTAYLHLHQGGTP